MKGSEEKLSLVEITLPLEFLSIFAGRGKRSSESVKGSYELPCDIVQTMKDGLLDIMGKRKGSGWQRTLKMLCGQFDPGGKTNLYEVLVSAVKEGTILFPPGEGLIN